MTLWNVVIEGTNSEETELWQTASIHMIPAYIQDKWVSTFEDPTQLL